eukprot:4909334-Pyramimonas_sp.AAC.1
MAVTVLRHVGARCSSLRIKSLITDVSLHSVGGLQTVAGELSFAFKETVGILQARGLPLSWGKMGFLCNDAGAFSLIEDEVADSWPTGVPFPGRG